MSKLISTKGRYALRLMLDLAVNGSGNALKIKDISERQGISPKYLEAIISALNREKFVRSTRGPQGGYVLTKRPDEYTVGSILRAVEGEFIIVPCEKEGMDYCDRFDTCTTVKLWTMIDEAIASVIDKVTLADLVSWERSQTMVALNI